MTDQIARIRVTLDDTKPAVWRRLELPLSNSLKTLHLAIQAAMLFENYHLFNYEVGAVRYGIRFDDDCWYPPTRDAAHIRLAKLVERGVTEFTYTYDFGDNWRHSIVIETVFPADADANYPRFVDGERRAPPEDVGGLSGFEELLDAMAKPRHPSRKSLLQWYGGIFDPTDIGLAEIRSRMATLAKRRAYGKAAYTKSRSMAQ